MYPKTCTMFGLRKGGENGEDSGILHSSGVKTLQFAPKGGKIRKVEKWGEGVGETERQDGPISDLGPFHRVREAAGQSAPSTTLP